jgi:DAK2 domain fusion protein YloV
VIKGSMLRDAFMSGAITIANNKKAVDELNVYPVPDGDTGTNMSMTMSAALRELERLDDNVTVAQVAEKTASALLRGARGNSGVILSLIFRGFAKGFAGQKTASCETIANALELGVEGAYKAVMKPTEGTILTVARLSSVKAQELAKTMTDPIELWAEVCKEAEATLEKTPDMLPVLKKAGVVDAGGKGLLIIFKAILDVFQGNPIAKPENAAPTKQITIENFSNTVGEFDEEINFTYCTEFIVQKMEGCNDALKLRAYLETIGDCVVVVEDDDIIKVHVHTDHPGKAFEEGLLFGSLINMKVENMREQHNDKAKQAKLSQKQEFVPAPPEKQFGFVAVAAGKGIEDMFKDVGVDVVVKGGQTMNPSTDDILAAINATPSEIVFVLPNNKNIIMAAEQAVSLADKKVCVLQTRTIPQGISAMLAFDPDADYNDNRINMTKAFERVSTGQVTFAARDSDYEGHVIKQGEILAMDNGKLAFVEKDVSKAAYKLTKKLVKGDSSFVTLIYGADVTDESAEALQEQLQAKLGAHDEVTLLNGGQPVYYYIISVE